MLYKKYAGRAMATALFSMSIIPVQAQHSEKDSLSCHTIEAVRITKIEDGKKHRLGTAGTDVLNHDAGKFLTVIPEISGIKKAGNYATDPVLRGFKYEQLNIVADGSAYAINACPSRMDPAISQINMNMVEEAEVFKGPYFFRYGNSFGGTLNFISRKPVFTEKAALNGRLSSSLESNGEIFRNEAFTELTSKKLVLDVFGSHQKGSRYRDGSGNEVRSAFLRYNIGSKASVKWNGRNLSTFQLTSNQGRNVEFAALKMDLIYDKTRMYQGAHQMEFHNTVLKSLDVNSFYSVVDHSMGTPDRTMISDVKSATFGGRGELKFMWDSSQLFTGLDYRREGAENIRMVVPAMMKPRDGTAWQDSEIKQAGWFNEFQHRFSNSRITASLRLDLNQADALAPANLFRSLYGDMQSHNLSVSISGGYTRNIGEKHTLSFWAGRAQRSGSLTERFINLFVVGNDAYEILGNPLLKPETNNQTDLIYHYSGNNIFFQANAFYSYLQEYISAVVRPDLKPYSMQSPGVRQMQNLEKAMKTGFESRLSWKFLPQISTDLAVAYTYGEDLTSGEPLAEIAPLDFRWKLNAELQPAVFGLNFRYVAAQNRIDSQFGELQTPEFTVWDITSKYEVLKNGYLHFDVFNLFDTAYAEHLNRTLSTDKAQRIRERGRSFNLGLSYSF